MSWYLWAKDIPAGNCRTAEVWNDADLGGNDAFKSTEATPESGYTDITGIEAWYECYPGTGYDYLFMRERIKELVTSITWASMSDAEKDLAAKLCCVDKSKRDERFTMAEQITHRQTHIKCKQLCQEDREAIAMAEVAERLSKSEAEELLDDIEDLLLLFKFGGRKGIDYGDNEGVIDYVKETPSSQWASGAGLLGKLWTPVGMTKEQLRDRLIDILAEGKK